MRMNTLLYRMEPLNSGLKNSLFAIVNREIER